LTLSEWLAYAPGMSNLLLKSLWDEPHAQSLDEPGQLLYRSNLLGADLRITNFGGGNTSAKVMEKDPLAVQLTVKCCGSRARAAISAR
jgi:rhamnose utilization protein RhaD (predicted bifunctional aldolase and dehydrogenase)